MSLKIDHINNLNNLGYFVVFTAILLSLQIVVIVLMHFISCEQGECWFQLSHSAMAAEMLGINPSILLKERLRTLEETASLMARAVVNKGNQICTNKHPDYEFFLSRRRY